MPSHYPNHCWAIVSWSIRNKLQRVFNQKGKFSFRKMYRKISSGIWRPFKAGEDKLIIQSCDQYYTLRWRHNDHTGVSNHQPHGCFLNRLFRRKSKKTSKLRVTGLCAGNSPGTGEFPAQMASYAENVSIWWRHHDICSEVVNDQPALINRVNLTNSPRPRQFATISIHIFQISFLAGI